MPVLTFIRFSRPTDSHTRTRVFGPCDGLVMDELQIHVSASDDPADPFRSKMACIAVREAEELGWRLVHPGAASTGRFTRLEIRHVAVDDPDERPAWSFGKSRHWRV